MPITNVDGGTLYYEVHGTGPRTIVFAHGGGGSHLSWWQQVPRFQDRFRCVVFDHRGSGQSSDDSGEGPRSFRSDLLQLFDRIEIDKATLVAQSMGGFTCLPFTALHPERVEALLMADTFLGLWDDRLSNLKFDVIESAVEAAARGERNLGLAPEFVRQRPDLTFLYQSLRDVTAAPMTAVPARERFGRAQGAVTPDQLTGLQLPVLFLAGEDDAIIPAPLIKQAAQLVPGARYLEVPGAGHSVYFEKPIEFNEALEGLLSEIQ